MSARRDRCRHVFFAIGTRALVGKAFREGFYWPSPVADAHEVVQTCPNCQQHAPYSKFPPYEVHLLSPVWPLVRWGIDIVGPLLTALGNYKCAAVAVEYFSMWIEAKVFRKITAGALQKIILAEHCVSLRHPQGGDRG